MWEKVLAELREIVMNQMFLTPQNDKFICFSLIWYRTWGEKEGSSMRRSSYLRSSFLLIRAFIYSESFFCINAKRSQALPLPTGVLQKHRNQLKVAELEATVGQVHLLPLTGPPQYKVHRTCPSQPLPPHSCGRTSVWASRSQGCVWDKCCREELITEWDYDLKTRPLEGQTENAPSD